MTSDASRDQPQWLDDLEMRVWRGWLEATGGAGQTINDGLKAIGGISHEDYEVLVHLAEAPEQRLRMSELSERLLHSQSRVTQRVDRLAKRGYVCREKCPADRRSTFTVLLPAGVEVLERTAPHHVADVRSALIDLVEPDELAVLAEILERIAAANRRT